MLIKKSLLKETVLQENIFLSITLFLIPISVGISGLTLFGALFYALYGIFKNVNKMHSEVKQYLNICLITLAYIVINCWLHGSWRLLPRYSVLVFFPIISLPVKWNISRKIDYFKYLNIGLIVSVLMTLFRYALSSKKEINYLAVESYLNIHPTYFSLFLILSISDILFNSRKRTILKRLLLVFFTIVILFIQSRIALITLGAVVILYLFYALSFFKTKRYLFLCVLGLLVSIFFVQGKIEGKTTFEFALTERFQIWTSSISVIADKPFLGHGTGNEYERLGKDFFLNGKLNLLDEKYNSHNNFLSIALQLGIIGMFLIVIVFIFPMVKYGLKIEYVSFLIIISLFSLTESLIHRHWGLVIVLIGGTYVSKMAIYTRA